MTPQKVEENFIILYVKTSFFITPTHSLSHSFDLTQRNNWKKIIKRYLNVIDYNLGLLIPIKRAVFSSSPHFHAVLFLQWLVQATHHL